MNCRVHAVGLGPAGSEYLTQETMGLLASGAPVWLRTSRHPAVAELSYSGSFDSLYETAETFDDVYTRVAHRLAELAQEHGEIVYAVPGSPLVAERTIELLRERSDIELTVYPSLSFVDLAWAALGIDPMQTSATIIDAHTFARSAAGRLGPMLITQVHSYEVLLDVFDALADNPPETVTLLKGLGTETQHVEVIDFGDLVGRVEADHLTSLWIEELAEPVAGAFVAFEELVRRLRQDCPWDAEQTHGSLRRFLLEETYEVLEVLDQIESAEAPVVQELYADLEEELGDLLFQILFHARLAAESGGFGISEVVEGIHDKLVARHPHVFAGADAETTIAGWEQAKQEAKERESVFDGIPNGLPALSYANEVLRKSSTAGFDTADTADQTTDPTAQDRLAAQLFELVVRCRAEGADAESLLRTYVSDAERRIRDLEILDLEKRESTEES